VLTKCGAVKKPSPMSTWLGVIVIGLSVGGCNSSAHLYPANDLAIPTGVLDARVVSHDNGYGEIEITLPDGEIVKGQYSNTRGGSVGGIYRSVKSNGDKTPQGNATVASLFGNHGTSIFCEFYADKTSGHGLGACRSFTGALYRLQY
jgi:hypothetical protein